MVHPLLGIHAAIGELGVAAFVWVFIELLSNKPALHRVRNAAIVGTIAFFISWFTGGYYYLVQYGPNVKPLIKAGAQPWIHSIVMEIKEHIFLFMPILALLTTALVNNYKTTYKKIIQKNSVLIVILGALMMTMGYIISTGAREALEAAVL